MSYWGGCPDAPSHVISFGGWPDPPSIVMAGGCPDAPSDTSIVVESTLSARRRARSAATIQVIINLLEIDVELEYTDIAMFSAVIRIVREMASCGGSALTALAEMAKMKWIVEV